MTPRRRARKRRRPRHVVGDDSEWSDEPLANPFRSPEVVHWRFDGRSTRALARRRYPFARRRETVTPTRAPDVDLAVRSAAVGRIFPSLGPPRLRRAGRSAGEPTHGMPAVLVAVSRVPDDACERTRSDSSCGVDAVRCANWMARDASRDASLEPTPGPPAGLRHRRHDSRTVASCDAPLRDVCSASYTLSSGPRREPGGSEPAAPFGSTLTVTAGATAGRCAAFACLRPALATTQPAERRTRATVPRDAAAGEACRGLLARIRRAGSAARSLRAWLRARREAPRSPSACQLLSSPLHVLLDGRNRLVELRPTTLHDP